MDDVVAACFPWLVPAFESGVDAVAPAGPASEPPTPPAPRLVDEQVYGGFGRAGLAGLNVKRLPPPRGRAVYGPR